MERENLSRRNPATRGILQNHPLKVECPVQFLYILVRGWRTKLANTKSALKEIRKNARRRVRNRLVRASTRTHVKRALQAGEGGTPDTEELLRRAVSALDKAAAKDVIHKNAAARRKSRLMKRLKTRADQTN